MIKFRVVELYQFNHSNDQNVISYKRLKACITIPTSMKEYLDELEIGAYYVYVIIITCKKKAGVSLNSCLHLKKDK